MTRIESNKTEIENTAENVYTYLSNFNNFQKLMPSQVTNWSSTETECSFTISGMATIGMQIVEKIPHSYIKISSHGKVPFDFILHVNISADGAKSIVQLVFEAELNPMIKMMVEKPLTNFFNLLAEKMKEIK
ncbi:MAG: SRPBCC family protein [Bacteroidia bacterium]|nr:SRPBCC family protein [Bacteroidia bacterium]